MTKHKNKPASYKQRVLTTFGCLSKCKQIRIIKKKKNLPVNGLRIRLFRSKGRKRETLLSNPIG